MPPPCNRKLHFPSLSGTCQVLRLLQLVVALVGVAGVFTPTVVPEGGICGVVKRRILYRNLIDWS